MRNLLIITIALMGFFTLSAQSSKPFSRLNVSLNTSTMGVGLEAATPLSPYFNGRVGLDAIGFNIGNHNWKLHDGNNALYDAIGFVPKYRMKAKFTLAHAHILADFHPIPGGIFHVATGFYLGSNKIKSRGFLADSNNNPATLPEGERWPVLDFDGNQIQINDGRIDMDLRLGNAIKPYLGFGLGRAITQNKLGFKFEMGVLYQGDYTLKQNGQKVVSNNSGFENFDDADKYTKWLKWWPMMNFQLTYNIF